jgi:acyl carrier protein
MTCLADSADSTGSPLLDLVRFAVATVLELPAASLDADTRLVDDLGVDSLAMIEIVEIVEERLRASGSDVRIADDLLARMQTVADVASAFGEAKETGAPL